MASRTAHRDESASRYLEQDGPPLSNGHGSGLVGLRCRQSSEGLRARCTSGDTPVSAVCGAFRMFSRSISSAV